LGFLNLLGMILFFVFLVWGFKMFFRGLRYSNGAGWMSGSCGPRYRVQHDEAVETARQRLAQGDIDAEEFEAIKSGLKTESTWVQGWAPWGRDRAIEVARMRFAKGEITFEEFEAVKKTLQA
jgi:putative membrane protein